MRRESPRRTAGSNMMDEATAQDRCVVVVETCYARTRADRQHRRQHSVSNARNNEKGVCSQFFFLRPPSAAQATQLRGIFIRWRPKVCGIGERPISRLSRHKFSKFH